MVGRLCGEQYSHGDICSSKISAFLNLNDYLLRVKSETPPLPTLSPLILSLGKKLPPNDVKISINFFLLLMDTTIISVTSSSTKGEKK